MTTKFYSNHFLKKGFPLNRGLFNRGSTIVVLQENTSTLVMYTWPRRRLEFRHGEDLFYGLDEISRTVL